MTPTYDAATETVDPAEVARTVAYLAATPEAYVVNEAVLHPLGAPWA
jgi:NADP-dependent 3-hydroxy acid dehydrogenase YdfG